MLINSLWILTNVVLTYINIKFISKIVNKRLENSLKNILIIILLSLIIALISTIKNGVISLLLQYAILNVVTNKIFKVEINKCIIAVIIFYVMLFVCDIVGVCTMGLLNFNLEPLGVSERKLLGDVVVIILLTIILNINPLIKGLQSIIYNSKIKILYYVIMFIISVIVCYMFLYYNIFNKTLEEMLINVMMIVLIAFIFIKFSIESASKHNIKEEYDKMAEYVKIYEEIIETDRIRRHENKNQLITIKGMVSKRDKKTHEYIESLISDNSDKNYKWLGELKNIPIGGLKGLLFYKVNKMRLNNIEVSITISRSLEGSKLQYIDTKLYKQLCQIIGVYVDNAMEACQEVDNKAIGIEIYKDGDIFEFIISNTYKGNMDIDNIDAAGYTTKGEGHGYGLSLVYDIIKSNPKFFQNREMVNEYYVQHLFLDLTE